MIHRSLRARVAAGVAAAALGISACGGDDDAADQPAASEAPGETTADASAPGTASAGTAPAGTEPGGSEPADDGRTDTFVAALNGQLPHLMRALRSEADIGLVSLTMNESLVTVNREKEIIPALAESWEIEEDGLLYRFHLRQGVTWHDGEPFNADDVVYTFEEGLLSSAGARVASVLDGVTKVDDYTVEVRLTSPYPVLLTTLTPADVGILPEHIYAGSDPMENPANMAPIGTGPFKFDSWDGNQIKVTAYDDYWGGRPAYDEVIFVVMSDANSRVQALKTGEIDYINGWMLPYESIRQLEGDPSIVVETGRPTTSQFQLGYNNEVLDEATRKALTQAIDRELISQSVYGGYSVPSTSPMVSESWARNADIDYNALYPYDPDAAKAALEAAGWSDGELSVRLRYQATTQGHAAAAEIIASNWRDVGVNVELFADEATVYLDEVYTQRNFDAFIGNLDARLDPGASWQNLFHCDNDVFAYYGNPTGYCNPEVDALLDEANSIIDQDARRELYLEVQEIVAEELPRLTLIEIRYSDAIRADIGFEGFFDRGSLIILDWASLEPPAG